MPDVPADNPSHKQYVQFGTRTLLWLTLVSAVLFAMANWIGAIWALVVAWFVLMIGAHVLGNSWGRQNYQRGERDPINEPPQVTRADAPAVIAQMQKQTSDRIDRIRLNRLVAAVALLGFLGGAAIPLTFGWPQLIGSDAGARNGIILSAVSAAVLGAFLGFWFSSFLTVSFGFGRAGLEGSAPHRASAHSAQQKTTEAR